MQPPHFGCCYEHGQVCTNWSWSLCQWTDIAGVEVPGVATAGEFQVKLKIRRSCGGLISLLFSSSACLLPTVWDLRCSSFNKSRQVEFWEMEVCQGFGYKSYRWGRVQSDVSEQSGTSAWEMREQLLHRRWGLWFGLWFKPLISLHLWRKMEGSGSILESVFHQIFWIGFFWIF